jgi:hypothetical protein
MTSKNRKGVGSVLDQAAQGRQKANQDPGPPDTSTDHQRTVNLPAELWRELDDAAMRRKYRRIEENKDREKGERVSTRASASEVIREVLQRHIDEVREFK